MHHVPNAGGTTCECASTHMNTPANADPLNCELRDCGENQVRHEDGINCRPEALRDCEPHEAFRDGACTNCGTNAIRSSADEAECLCERGHGTMGTGTNELPLNCQLLDCGMNEGRASDGVSCEACEPHEFVENNACMECPEDQIRGNDGSCEACPDNHGRARGESSCTQEACDAATEIRDGSGMCVECGTDQMPNDAGDACVCTRGHDNLGTAAAPNCADACGPNERRGDDDICMCPHFGSVGSCALVRPPDSCADNAFVNDMNACEECPADQVRGDDNSCTACDMNEVRARGDAACSCPLFMQTNGDCVPFMNCGTDQVLRMGDNTCADSCSGNNEEVRDGVCHCMERFVRVAGICEMECSGTQIRVNGLGDCVERVSCVGGEVTAANECQCPNDRPDNVSGTCLAECGGENEIRQGQNCVCNANFERDGEDCAACLSGESSPIGGMCAETALENCADTQKLSSAGECVPLAQSDCTPLEKFENGRCVLLMAEDCSPGICSSLPPYDGEYTATTCTSANWPWSIVQTADGLSELCHAPVNLLAESPSPSAAVLMGTDDKADFCVLRGHSGADSVRCDDPSIFGNLGIPSAPAGLVAQTTSTITITLDDGSERTATTVTAAVTDHLQVVHVSGSVVAVFPPNTTESQITTANPLVGTISLTAPDPTVSTMPPPATNTMTPPASGGGDSGGGGGGAAAALIAVPVVLIGGYWLLGGFDYVDPTYDLSYSGKNEDFSYATQGGFDLNHGRLSSYAYAIQSDGEAVSYQSGISYGEDFYSLNYAAHESQSEYNYDLSANLSYGSGLWTISPSADAEFNYSADREDWTADASAGISAVWAAHRWIVRAQSDFAGENRHRLEIQRDL